jgi:hypothetical protein
VLEQRGDSTIPESGSELRSAPRVSLMLRAAKLVSPAGEFLCILRDVSATGLKARLFHPVPPGEPIMLELGNGARYPLEPVWTEDDHVGFQFCNGPVDLTELVDEASHFPKRQLRLKLALPITVATPAGLMEGVLHDLSQHGALIEVDHFLALRQIVKLGSADFPDRHARVRWRNGKAHGLVFHEGFRMDELALLVERLQTPAGRLAPARRVNH